MSSAAPYLPITVRTFTQRLPSTRRGARQARQLAAEWLRVWRVPRAVAERVELVVAELAANAALHGHVRGRDFRLTLTFDTTAGTLRVEATDARGERLPRPVAAGTADAETGRGLLLVAALADRWGTDPFPPSGKTVWAEVVVAPLGDR
jgi:anti-sigma regulatory factor (Ser/Thr protein kinase)